MRKFTFLFGLLVAFATTVQAQITSISETSNTTKYSIRTNDRGSWYVPTQASAVYSTTKLSVSVDPSSPTQQFAFISYEGNYYLWSVSESKFIGKNGNGTGLSTTPSNTVTLLTSSGSTSFPTVVALDGTIQLGVSNSYDPPIISFWNDLSDAGNQVAIEAVPGDFDPTTALAYLDNYFHPAATVTYVVVDEGNNELFRSAAVPATLDDEITTLPAEYQKSAFYDYNTVSHTVVTGSNEVTFTATLKANPYISFTADATAPVWYNLMIRGKYLSYDATGTGEVALKGTSEPFNAKSSWAFIGNPYDGFVLVNKEKGTDNYLTWTSVVVARHDANNIQFQTDNSKKWILEQNNCSDYPGGFVLRMKDNTNIYFHHNSSNGGFLRTCSTTEWGSVHNDPGSTIIATTDEAALIALYNELSSITFGNGANQYGTDGTITTDEATATVTSVGNVVTNHISAAYADAYTALKALSEKLSLNMPTAGFYRIKGATSNKYLAAGLASNNKFNMTTDVDASTIFYFDGAKLVNYGTGLCNGMSASAWSWTTEANASTVTFEDGNTYGGYGIKSTNAYFYDNGDNSNSADRGQSASMTSGSERYRKWFLESVSSLPISLTAVADANYSTLYMPVPVEVSGAEVFTAQLVGEDLRAVALAGAIPANTGVILKGTTTEATANIVNAADAVETALTGSVGAIAPVAGSYVFSIVGGDLGFYSFGGDELKGFKAYYVSASPVQGFKLDFGSATAIKQAETTKAGQAIYDLSGRRVEKAVKGVYIVGGKKVIK